MQTSSNSLGRETLTDPMIHSENFGSQSSSHREAFTQIIPLPEDPLERIFIPDILFRVFEYLEPEDLGYVAQVCKVFNTAASDPLLWKSLSYQGKAFLPFRNNLLEGSEQLKYSKEENLQIAEAFYEVVQKVIDKTYKEDGPIVFFEKSLVTAFEMRRYLQSQLMALEEQGYDSITIKRSIFIEACRSPKAEYLIPYIINKLEIEMDEDLCREAINAKVPEYVVIQLIKLTPNSLRFTFLLFAFSKGYDCVVQYLFAISRKGDLYENPDSLINKIIHREPFESLLALIEENKPLYAENEKKSPRQLERIKRDAIIFALMQKELPLDQLLDYLRPISFQTMFKVLEMILNLPPCLFTIHRFVDVFKNKMARIPDQLADEIPPLCRGKESTYILIKALFSARLLDKELLNRVLYDAFDCGLQFECLRELVMVFGGQVTVPERNELLKKHKFDKKTQGLLEDAAFYDLIEYGERE